MRFLLDTNICIASLDRNDTRVAARIIRHGTDSLGVSAASIFELWYGAARSQHRERNFAALEKARFNVLELSEADARSAAELRAKLEGIGQPIGPYDLLIAGQALARGLILVTNNRREFDRVEGLQVEDWL